MIATAFSGFLTTGRKTDERKQTKYLKHSVDFDDKNTNKYLKL
jgi:hypothetical protein